MHAQTLVSRRSVCSLRNHAPAATETKVLHATLHHQQKQQPPEQQEQTQVRRRLQQRGPRALVRLATPHWRVARPDGIKRRQWSAHHAQVLASLRQQRCLPQASRVLVAVSGGQDSMAMLRLLLDLQQPHLWPLELVVAHCDHSMRPDSADNALFVRQHAQQLGLPYCQSTAEPQQLRSEESARNWRLRQLQQLAQQASCSHVAVGHTTTDRAETLLLNLVRGAGAAGLGSMAWARHMDKRSSITLVRPLLELAREDTAAVCELTRTPIWEDSTNQDQRYARNRLRLSVFPQLLAINRQAARHMAQASELLHADSLLLDAMASEQLQQHRLRVLLVPPAAQPSSSSSLGREHASGAGVVGACSTHASNSDSRSAAASTSDSGRGGTEAEALPVPPLVQLPLALRQRAVRAWLSQLCPRAVPFAMASEVLLLLTSARQDCRTSSLWSGHCVLRHEQLLLIVRDGEAQRLLSRELRVVTVAWQQQQQQQQQHDGV